VTHLPKSGIKASAVFATQSVTNPFQAELNSKKKSHLGCGLIMPTQWVNSPNSVVADPVTGWTSSQFVKQFIGFYGAPPSYQTASAAAVTVAISNAIKAAGGADDLSKVAQGMASLNVDSFYGKIKFANDGSMAVDGKPMMAVQQLSSGPELVAPVSMASVRMLYPVDPSTCEAHDVTVVTNTVVTEETPGWVVPVIVVAVVIIIVLFGVATCMYMRVRNLLKACEELRKAGINVQRPSLRDMAGVAVGVSSASKASQRISQRASTASNAA